MSERCGDAEFVMCVSSRKQKYCPALVVMLRTVGGMRNRDICEYLGVASGTVGNIITRRGLADGKRRRDINIDEVERDYLAGASTYELGEKYGVHHATISKWMKKRGHVRGKGHGPACGKNNKGSFGNRKASWPVELREARFVERLASDSRTCMYEYVSGYVTKNDKCTVRCKKCGAEKQVTPSQLFHCKYDRHICFNCLRIEREKKKICRIDEYKKACEEEFKKEKVCVSCGSVYHSISQTSKYCSKKCKTRFKNKRLKAKNGSGGSSRYKKRARYYGVEYESGITLRKIESRDNGICQICGKPCDRNDKRYGSSGPLYPTIDHIVAMKNGGGHVWENVQLAHSICNSYKRDLDESEFTTEVIVHAEKQAVAYKCA